MPSDDLKIPFFLTLIGLYGALMPLVLLDMWANIVYVVPWYIVYCLLPLPVIVLAIPLIRILQEREHTQQLLEPTFLKPVEQAVTEYITMLPFDKKDKAIR